MNKFWKLYWKFWKIKNKFLKILIKFFKKFNENYNFSLLSILIVDWSLGCSPSFANFLGFFFGGGGRFPGPPPLGNATDSYSSTSNQIMVQQCLIADLKLSYMYRVLNFFSIFRSCVYRYTRYKILNTRYTIHDVFVYRVLNSALVYNERLRYHVAGFDAAVYYYRLPHRRSTEVPQLRISSKPDRIIR